MKNHVFLLFLFGFVLIAGAFSVTHSAYAFDANFDQGQLTEVAPAACTGDSCTGYIGCHKRGQLECNMTVSFSENMGQVWKWSYSNIQNDNPTPRVYTCINGTLIWGTGACWTVQDANSGNQQYGGDNIGNTNDYKAFLMVRVSVNGGSTNSNDFAGSFTAYRRELSLSDVTYPSSVNKNADVKVSWTGSGSTSRILHYSDPNGDYSYYTPPETANDWSLPIDSSILGTHKFTLEMSGPTRFGGGITISKDFNISVSNGGGNTPPPVGNKYRCSGAGTCILDNTFGNYTTSNCNNECSSGGGTTNTYLSCVNNTCTKISGSGSDSCSSEGSSCSSGGCSLALLANSGVRGNPCTDVENVAKSSKSDCSSWCEQNNATGCEWNGSRCWRYSGNGCKTETFYAGWYAAVCNKGSICGNGEIEGSEECDNGRSNGSCPATCSNSCKNNNCGPLTGTVSGRVFIDANGNGTRDGNESGYDGGVVALRDSSDTNTISQTNPNGGGNYSLNGSGSLRVKYYPDSGYSCTTDCSVPIGLPPNATVDFGIKLNQYSACNSSNGTCQVKNGTIQPGEVSCSSNEDCYHNVCGISNGFGVCNRVNSPGTGNCSTDANCNHAECVEGSVSTGSDTGYYTNTCKNFPVPGTSQCTLSPNNCAPIERCTLSANPNRTIIPPPATTTLSYVCQPAPCSMNPAISPAPAFGYSTRVVSPTSTTNYVLSCGLNNGGSASASSKVRVYNFSGGKLIEVNPGGQ